MQGYQVVSSVATQEIKIKSGIENPSKSEIIGRCCGDEKNE